MPQGCFKAQLDAWAKETQQRIEAVHRESTQRVIEEMQRPVAAGGNLPVDTGFLRASLVASLGTPTMAVREKPEGDAAHSYDAGQVTLVIASAKLTDVIFATYGANYARFVEYGARGRPGRAFVGLAAQKWQRIVSEVAAEAKGRAGA